MDEVGAIFDSVVKFVNLAGIEVLKSIVVHKILPNLGVDVEINYPPISELAREFIVNR